MKKIQQFEDTLRLGHQAIKQDIVALRLLARSYPDARGALRDLENVLMGHLGRQDQTYFDELNSFYHESREDLKMLEFLLHDLKEMKIKTLLFFDKYSGGTPISEARTFPRDFGQFTEDILDRIRIEEEYFLPRIHRLVTEA